MFLALEYKYFVENYCIYSYKENCFVILFLCWNVMYFRNQNNLFKRTRHVSCFYVLEKFEEHWWLLVRLNSTPKQSGPGLFLLGTLSYSFYFLIVCKFVNLLLVQLWHVVYTKKIGVKGSGDEVKSSGRGIGSGTKKWSM